MASAHCLTVASALGSPRHPPFGHAVPEDTCRVDAQAASCPHPNKLPGSGLSPSLAVRTGLGNTDPDGTRFRGQIVRVQKPYDALLCE